MQKIEAAREQIESALQLFINQMGEKNRLRDACEYALLNGGKRLRPILVLLIADALKSSQCVLPIALSVEFFHTASLIADDLPCMDDDRERRERPSLHVTFGEDLAILASYALIAEGYGGIYRNSRENPDLAVLCLKEATRCAGIQGATNGQFLDLYPPRLDFEEIQKIIYQKTITLFEISFVFGWLFGGGEKKRLPKVRACAYHLGMTFQIADDFLDDSQDGKRRHSVNIIKAIGREKASLLLEEQMGLFKELLMELGLLNEAFQAVIAWLKDYPLSSFKEHKAPL